MFVIEPITITDAMFVSSSVSEDDESVFDISTTYALGERVIVTTGAHKIYESAQGGNIGNDPTTDDGTYWTEISATNRWKVFDSKLADQAEDSTGMSWRITPTTPVTAIAFFNLNADEVRVRVYDDQSPSVKVYDKTITLVDTADIIDWFTYFTTDLSDQIVDKALFSDLLAFAGYEILINVGDAGASAVGEIVVGNKRKIGETVEGSTLRLQSFSTKEQDAFGNWNIVSRAKSDPIEFLVSIGAGEQMRRARTRLTALRDTSAVYYADMTTDTDVIDYGAMTYGFVKDHEIALVKNGQSIMRVEIEAQT